jgi:hypothetical protein
MRLTPDDEWEGAISRRSDKVTVTNGAGITVSRSTLKPELAGTPPVRRNVQYRDGDSFVAEMLDGPDVEYEKVLLIPS